MKRIPVVCSILLMILLTLTAGCVDGVRQTVAPYFFGGVQTIADGLITGSDPNSLTNGAQTITDGVIAGLQHSFYPKSN